MVETTERDVTQLNPVSKRPGARALVVQDGTLQAVSVTSLVSGIDYSTLDNRPTLGPLAGLATTAGTARFLREDGTFQTVPNTGGSGSVAFSAILGSPTDNASLATALSQREPVLQAGTALQYLRGDKTMATLNKAAVGLANVDNTADMDKPVSSATTVQLNLKQGTIPAGTTGQYYRGDKTMADLNKAAVGLASVDNTSDVSKPVSTATQTALDLKQNKLTVGAASQYLRGDLTLQTLDKNAVGLSNVNNTADADKPVSSAVATQLNGKEPSITAGTTAQYWRGDKTWQNLPQSSGLTNPMTNAGDIIIGGNGGAPARVGRGGDNTVLTLDPATGLPSWKAPTGGAASNANNVYLDSINGPNQRTAQQKFRERVSAFDFGAIGNDRNGDNKLSSRFGSLAAAQAVYPFVTSLNDQIDWAAMQAMVNFSRDQGRPVTLAGGRFNINRATILSGYYDIDGEGATIGGQYQTAGRIFQGVAPDLTYPGPTTPAVLSGCAFYCNTTPYYSKFKNMSFFDFRFAIAFYGTPNTPFFKDVEFNYTQCAVIYYNGCQNPRYYGCGGIELGVLHVSSATCFPEGHPQAGDDFYFSDNLKFSNEFSFNSFGPGNYPDFDAWFIASILRPNVLSKAYQQPDQRYNDRNGNVYTDPYYLNPTGRLIFAPFRNGRDCFGVYLDGLDIRGPFKYGYMLVNTQVRDLRIAQCQYEQLFIDGQDPTLPIIGTVGAVVAGTIEHQNQLTYIDNDHPLLKYSGRGKSDGFEDGTGILELNPTLNKRFGEMGHRGYLRGKHYIADVVTPFADNKFNPQNNGSDNAPIDAGIDMRGHYLEDNYLITMVENIPNQFFLPSITADGKVRSNLNLSLKPFVGQLEVTIWNSTRGGAPDFAVYHIDSASTQTLTLSKALNNGDTVASFNQSIDSGYDSPRFAYYEVQGQTYGFMADGAGGNDVRCMGDGNRFRGLPAGGIPVNTTIIRRQALIPIIEFKRGWAAVTSVASPTQGFDGTVDFQGGGTIGIKNLTGTYANANANDMLVVQTRLRQIRTVPGDIYRDAAPTSGRWRVGATVKRSLGGTSPVLEWTCVTPGESVQGSWVATRSMPSSGATAARPTGLTANDKGYDGFFNTTLGRKDYWSGTAWL